MTVQIWDRPFLRRHHHADPRNAAVPFAVRTSATRSPPHSLTSPRTPVATVSALPNRAAHFSKPLALPPRSSALLDPFRHSASLSASQPASPPPTHESTSQPACFALFAAPNSQSSAAKGVQGVCIWPVDLINYYPTHLVLSPPTLPLSFWSTSNSNNPGACPCVRSHLAHFCQDIDVILRSS